MDGNSGSLEETSAMHLYYVSRDGMNIQAEQWSLDFLTLLDSATIPWHISGRPEGGLQTDLADCPVLQGSPDFSGFVIRSFLPLPFTGLGPEEENSSSTSALYFYKSATAEFRELVVVGADSVIGNFLYVPEASAVFYELINQNEYSLNRLELSYPLQPAKAIYKSTNELFRFRYDVHTSIFYAMIQDGENILELSNMAGSDSILVRNAGSISPMNLSLPVSSSSGVCVACPLLPMKKRPASSLKIFCKNLPEKEVFLNDRIITSELIEPDNLLVIGKESISLLDVQGNILYKVCLKEPELLGIDQDQFYLRSGDYTLRFSGESSEPDTLQSGIHERFFDLLGVRKGVRAGRRI